MTTIRKAVGGALRYLSQGVTWLADRVHPEGAGGAGPLPPPKPK